MHYCQWCFSCWLTYCIKHNQSFHEWGAYLAAFSCRTLQPILGQSMQNYDGKNGNFICFTSRISVSPPTVSICQSCITHSSIHPSQMLYWQHCSVTLIQYIKESVHEINSNRHWLGSVQGIEKCNTTQWSTKW